MLSGAVFYALNSQKKSFDGRAPHAPAEKAYSAYSYLLAELRGPLYGGDGRGKERDKKKEKGERQKKGRAIPPNKNPA